MTNDSRDRHDRSADSIQCIDDLVALELGTTVAHDRMASGAAPKAAEVEAGELPIACPPRDLFGLALSGGGIRSATFNLGLLQGLDRYRLLPVFDYLSTVSGGGYVGGFWTAWRSRCDNAMCERGWEDGRRLARPDDSVFPPARGPESETRRGPVPEITPGEGRAIRHLREFGNFLRPRLALFSMDTGRIAAALVSAVLPSLIATIACLAALICCWVALGAGLLDERAWVSLVFLFGTTVVALVGFEAWWTINHRRGTKRDDPGAEEQGTRGYLVACVVGCLGTGAGWLWWGADLRAADGARRLSGDLFDASGSTPELQAIFAPAIFWGFGCLALVVLRWIRSRWAHTFDAQVRRAALDRALSRFLLLAVAWSCTALLWWFGLEAYTFHSLSISAGTTVVSGGLFAWLRRLASRQPSRPVGKITALLRPILVQVLATLTVAALAALTIFLILAVCEATSLPVGVDPSFGVWSTSALHSVGDWMGVSSELVDRIAWRFLEPWMDLSAGIWLALGIALLVTMFTLLSFDPNEMGFHAFYRNRLARTYLGASVERGRNPGVRGTGPCEDDDLRFGAFQEGDPSKKPCVVTDCRPIQLICCTANDLSPADPLANLHRGGESAVISPVAFTVGEDHVAWRHWLEKGLAPVRLSSALTASGAAFNSHMGSRSRSLGAAVTFLMTTLNLRLGLWLTHPRTMTEARSGLWSRIAHAVAPWFVGRRFFFELFGISRARGGSVFLSDGGHFENLGLYELVRRRCRYVLLSDCGADPDVAFDDFGNAVRRVREDFGVEIDIDLDPLRPGTDRRARQPMVAGTLRYPDGDTGVLLYIKPTLTGDVPADVAQYARRNERFPHENTIDQFYDEAQWEAYRRLGQHVAELAFRRFDPDSVEIDARGVKVFTQARFQWRPLPENMGERAARLMARCSELEERLCRSKANRLRREVYRELELEAAPTAGVTGMAELVQQPEAQPGADDEADKGEIRSPVGPHLTDAELVETVRMLVEALHFMLEVFEELEGELRSDHPVVLGWTNSFARWTGAPLFRMWWPLLKARTPIRFAEFLESKYGLDDGCSGECARADGRPWTRLIRWKRPRPYGYAWERWLTRGRRGWAESGASPGRRDLLFFLDLHLRDGMAGAKPTTLDRIVRVSLLRGVSVTRREAEGGPRRITVWDSEDLFVPAGLWGMGFGGALLDELPRKLNGTSHLMVARVAAPKGSTWGDAPQLYRSRGFVQATAVRTEPGQGDDRWRIGLPVLGQDRPSWIAVPLASESGRTPDDYCWLVRWAKESPQG